MDWFLEAFHIQWWRDAVYSVYFQHWARATVVSRELIIFANRSAPTILNIMSPYAPIRAHTPAIRTAKAILGMIGDYPMLRRLAQLQIAVIAAESAHFKTMMCSLREKFQLDFQV